MRKCYRRVPGAAAKEAEEGCYSCVRPKWGTTRLADQCADPHPDNPESNDGVRLDLERGEAVRLVLDAAEGRMDAVELAVALKGKATAISLFSSGED